MLNFSVTAFLFGCSCCVPCNSSNHTKPYRSYRSATKYAKLIDFGKKYFLILLPFDNCFPLSISDKFPLSVAKQGNIFLFHSLKKVYFFRIYFHKIIFFLHLSSFFSPGREKSLPLRHFTFRSNKKSNCIHAH